MPRYALFLMALSLTALFLISPASTALARGTDAAHRCDALAGYVEAPRIAGSSSVPHVVDAPGAVAACEAALQDLPEDPYLRLQLARAYTAADRDDPRAFELLEDLRDGLPSLSRLRLARLYESGDAGLSQDRPRALALYEEVCAMRGLPGISIACSNLAVLLREEGGEANNARALSILELHCGALRSLACVNLGFEYDIGEIVEQDLPRAAELYRIGCDGGDTMGCTNLGYAYVHGYNGVVDIAYAVALYRDACDLGEGLACNNLGVAIADGDAGPVDPAAAAALYLRACEADVPLGCENLADAYVAGAGVEADVERAMQYYTLGCEGGEAWSCQQMQEITAPGTPNEPDNAPAMPHKIIGAKAISVP